MYFVLTIPKTFSKYHRFRILPIPDGDNRELVLSLDVDYIRKNEKLFKLENHKIKPLNDPCLENLLNDKLSNCTFKTNKETSVTFVQPNMVLTKNLDQITVYQNCNDLNVSIYGNNLLTFSNCRLKIGYFEIESKINIAQTSIVPFVKTSENLIKNTKDYITKLELRNDYHKYYSKREKNYIIYALIIFIMLILFTTKLYNTRKTRCVRKINEDIEISREGRSDVNIP